MIPDGTGITHTTLSRWYNGGAPLAIDELICGLVRTYSSDAPIADSAPSSSAYATGYKSQTGNVGVMPSIATMYGLTRSDVDPMNRPLVSILEGARLSGRSTGLVATCEIPHATPADFSAHHFNRGNYDAIIEQQVYNSIDVVFAGGYKYLLPETRKDKEDLVSVLKTNGYSVIRTRDELLTTTSRKVWGLFAPKALAYDLDRSAQEPTLEEMTKKAIELLSKNNNGFFLMVEGSKIDWASHANEPIGVISDFLAYDRAVKAALDFAKKDGNTVVIVVPDHSNGGMSIGNSGSDGKYDELPLNEIIDPLKKATLTAEGTERTAYEKNIPLTDAIAQYYGITDLTEDEKNELKTAKKGELPYFIGPMLSKRSYIGWTTNGHTGEEVFFGVYHPAGYRPTGVILNSDVAKYMAEVMTIDLTALNKKLYLPAESTFTALGAVVTIDTTDAENPVLIVKKNTHELRLPANKNIAVLDGKTIVLRSLVVQNGKGFFVPQETVDLLK